MQQIDLNIDIQLCPFSLSLPKKTKQTLISFQLVYYIIIIVIFKGRRRRRLRRRRRRRLRHHHYYHLSRSHTTSVIHELMGVFFLLLVPSSILDILSSSFIWYVSYVFLSSMSKDYKRKNIITQIKRCNN